MLPNPNERPSLTVAEAAAILGISLPSCYEAVRTGAIPSLRIGRRLVIPTEKLLHLLGFEPTVAGAALGSGVAGSAESSP